MNENLNEVLDRFKGALLSFSVEDVRLEVLNAIKLGVPVEKLIEASSDAMAEVGRRYEAGELFVTDLIVAGETMKEATEALKPYMHGERSRKLDTVVLATVAGDIHDIGKSILATLMNAAGFNVLDLGVDVPADVIVQAVKSSGAGILGLSALLTTNLEQIPIIVDGLKKEGIRNRVKVIVGGATVTEDYAEKAGVDGYAKTAVDGIEICKKWSRED